MWFESQARLRDYLHYAFKDGRVRVGFCPETSGSYSFLFPYFQRYNNVMASTRLRTNDIIYYALSDPDLEASFYNPLRRYDIVVFQKYYDRAAAAIARKQRKKGAKVVLDINVNYFDTKSERIESRQSHDITAFVTLCDLVVTTTDYLRDYIVSNGVFTRVEVIPEAISDHFFAVRKTHQRKDETVLLYVGYSHKANELLLIKGVLQGLARRHRLRLLFICENRPDVDIGLPMEYLTYNQATLPDDILRGDVFLAPRDLSERYNLGHSFTKVGYPMSVGLPVVASPVPSYAGSPAVICNSPDEWEAALELLISDETCRAELAEPGIVHCWQHYSRESVMRKYRRVFCALAE